MTLKYHILIDLLSIIFLFKEKYNMINNLYFDTRDINYYNYLQLLKENLNLLDSQKNQLLINNKLSKNQRLELIKIYTDFYKNGITISFLSKEFHVCYNTIFSDIQTFLEKNIDYELVSQKVPVKQKSNSYQIKKILHLRKKYYF